jgi:hypothetical protein
MRSWVKLPPWLSLNLPQPSDCRTIPCTALARPFKAAQQDNWIWK